jgi:Rab-GTPase-TBC domain
VSTVIVLQVWFEVSGAAARAQKFPPRFYDDLLKTGAPVDVSEDIVKDIDRTYPGHTFFEHEVNMGALQRLLTAFAVRNPEIGYCQSLNFVAGMLLLHLPEEDAFWILDVIVNEILPPGYYEYGGVFHLSWAEIGLSLMSAVFVFQRGVNWLTHRPTCPQTAVGRIRTTSFNMPGGSRY